MGIRQMLDRSPKLALVVIGVLVLVAALISRASLRQTTGPRPVSEGKVYFTTDDGKTWFADSITRPSPFTKDGKVAYHVYVWKVADGTVFVSHLQRGASSSSAHELSRPSPSRISSGGGVEVKRPGTGDKGWTRINTIEGDAIVTPRSPSGNNTGLEAVEP